MGALLLSTPEVLQHRGEGLDPLGGGRRQADLDVIDSFCFERMERSVRL